MGFLHMSHHIKRRYSRFWSTSWNFSLRINPKILRSELAALYASIVALAWYLFNKLGTQYGTTGLKDCLWTSISALRFEILNQLCNIWQHSIMTSWMPIKHQSGFDYSSWDESMIFLLVQVVNTIWKHGFLLQKNCTK